MIHNIIIALIGLACILLVDFRALYERVWAYCFICAVVVAALFRSQA
jgi:hypothetical protein